MSLQNSKIKINSRIHGCIYANRNVINKPIKSKTHKYIQTQYQ